MKTLPFFAVISAALIGTAGAVQPPVALLDNSSSGLESFSAVTTDVPFAQGFTTPNNGISYQLTSVTLCKLVTLWNPPAPIARVSLWSNSGGLPGTELGLIGSATVGGDGDLTIPASSSLFVAPNTSYFIRFDAPQNFWELSGTPPGSGNTGVASFGPYLEYYMGANWITISGAASMRLMAVVPEPSTVALFLTAAVAVAAVRTRKVG